MKLLVVIAALLMASPCFATDDDYPFDRLFSDASERSRLDRVRAGTERPQSDQQAPPPVERVAVSELDETVQKVEFSGYVRRSDGTIVLWVDGTSNPGNGNSPGELLDASNEALFRAADKEQRLKPGQTWVIGLDTVADTYEEVILPPTDPENGGYDIPGSDVLPEVAVPDVAIPDVAIPDVAIPGVALPDIEASDIEALDVEAIVRPLIDGE